MVSNVRDECIMDYEAVNTSDNITKNINNINNAIPDLTLGQIFEGTMSEMYRYKTLIVKL